MSFLIRISEFVVHPTVEIQRPSAYMMAYPLATSLQAVSHPAHTHPVAPMLPSTCSLLEGAGIQIQTYPLERMVMFVAHPVPL